MGLTAGGKVRRLTVAARPALLAHLMGLDADDRYGRFATAMPDGGITAYVARINFTRDPCFATEEPDGAISGFIHLAVHGKVAELGASVSPGWRRQGRAWMLFGTALFAARVAGIREVFLATGHPAARHICAGLGYAMVENQAYPRIRVRMPGMPVRDANLRHRLKLSS